MLTIFYYICSSDACANIVCEACENARAYSMIQMYGQPYNNNTLATVPPNPDAMMNRVSIQKSIKGELQAKRKKSIEFGKLAS